MNSETQTLNPKPQTRYEVAFTTVNPIPAKGYVNVTFPPGFLLTPGVTAIAALTGMSSPGTIQIRSASGSPPSLRFLCTALVPAGSDVAFQMVDVRTALNTGAVGTFLVRTQNFLGQTSDQSPPINLAISHGILQNAIVEYSGGSHPFIHVPPREGGTWNVSFVISSPLADGHTVQIELPPSFTAAYPGIGRAASYEAGFTFNISTATPVSDSYVLITFSAPTEGSTLPTGSGVWFQLSNVTIASTAVPYRPNPKPKHYPPTPNLLPHHIGDTK